ncbi:hypothetical protein [Lyngbya sp. CCY1209]|nr:hypothetical protein [Lyngbya sp. CCY1209]MEB3882240.1 hypothetical protein [Lyngbya sp. CCY1209]
MTAVSPLLQKTEIIYPSADGYRLVEDGYQAIADNCSEVLGLKLQV